MSDNAQHTLTTYVSDMLALERHIGEPLDRQERLEDTGRFSEAARVTESLNAFVKSHVSALEARLEQLGGNANSPVKSAWSGLLGLGAAAVDGARKTKVSKNLRDDSTALGLATISYTMLYTTAIALGDRETADLSLRHLNEYAKIVMQIGRVMPSVVLAELASDGVPVDRSVSDEANQTVQEMWQVAS